MSASEASSAATGAVLTFPPKLGSRIRSALISTTAVVVAVALLVNDGPAQWIAWVLLLGELPIAVIRWLAIRETRRQPWALRVDEAGIWWSPRRSPMPWASIKAIEVHQARGLRRLLPHLNRVVLIDRGGADFARRAKTQPLGRNVLLSQVRATPQEVVAALRRYTDVPTRLRSR